MNFHIVSPEYPTAIGGVGEHARLLACELAERGHRVAVWTAGEAAHLQEDAGVQPFCIGPRFSPAALYQLDQALSASPQPRTLLVQWVPHGYGYKSMNLPFCLWVASRALRGDTVDLIVHEAYLSFSLSRWKQNAAAMLHRLMISILLVTATRVWVTIPAWTERLKPYAMGRDLGFHWFPVPSNVAATADGDQIRSVRAAHLPQNCSHLIGHFGTFGADAGPLLNALIPELLTNFPKGALLLIGANSEICAQGLHKRWPSLASRISGTGSLKTSRLSEHIAACDLAVQPYHDGISSRRTSSMAILAHGVPLVTNIGFLSEPLWMSERGLAIVENFTQLASKVVFLLNNAVVLRNTALVGKELYLREFSRKQMMRRFFEKIV